MKDLSRPARVSRASVLLLLLLVLPLGWSEEAAAQSRQDFEWSSEARVVGANALLGGVQYDQSFLTLGDPLENWLARRFPSLRGTLEQLQFNAPVLAITAILGFYVWKRHDQQLWEREAVYLGRTR